MLTAQELDATLAGARRCRAPYQSSSSSTNPGVLANVTVADLRGVRSRLRDRIFSERSLRPA
jgi:hypothetical protein